MTFPTPMEHDLLDKEESAGRKASSPGTRLAPEKRRQLILDSAISFFAKNGLSSQTRDLAKYIGVSQGLIFKYFESKEKLIECIYEEIFLDHWNPEWEIGLKNRSKPLRERLISFYLDYHEVVSDYNWIRICFQASLSNQDLTRRYIDEYLSGLLRSIAMEIRQTNGVKSRKAPTDLELEKVWIAHSAIVYHSIRSNVHRTAVMSDAHKFVSGVIDTVLFGMARK